MLSKPDERVTRALAILARDAQFQCLREWLEAERARLAQAMSAERSDVELRMQQGASQTLSRILDAAERAAS